MGHVFIGIYATISIVVADTGNVMMATIRMSEGIDGSSRVQDYEVMAEARS